MANNLHKRQTHEDKFDRKFWVHNKAKRIWLRFTKRSNEKKFRRIGKQEVRKSLDYGEAQGQRQPPRTE